MTDTIEFSAFMPCDSESLYRWHTMPRALNRLTPPWEKVEILSHPSHLVAGERVHIRLNGFIDWKLRITKVNQGYSFSDSQISGPFAKWTHEHLMQPVDTNKSLLIEKINFSLPIIGSSLNELLIRYKLKPLFDYRFRVMSNDLKLHSKYSQNKPLRILISGSSGLVGNALVDFFSSGGHEVFKLVRHQSKNEQEIYWDPELKSIEKSHLEGMDVVIHLAGENIANKRWTPKQKNKIAYSRFSGTDLLVNTIKQLDQPPSVFISASAIGFYGQRADEVCDELSSSGKGFLAETCKEWESITKLLEPKSIRVINTRFGIILDPRAGALSKILPIFQLGAGGNLGNGRQWMSWIALDDVLGAILHCIHNQNISGPVNFVSPNPVTNSSFTQTLSKKLMRPAIFPAPAFALRLALGEMADELLLSSTRVHPRVLETTDYEFRYPNLDDALNHICFNALH